MISTTGLFPEGAGFIHEDAKEDRPRNGTNNSEYDALKSKREASLLLTDGSQRCHHTWHRCKEREENATELDNYEGHEEPTVTGTGLPFGRATLQELGVKSKMLCMLFEAYRYADTFCKVVGRKRYGATS